MRTLDEVIEIAADWTNGFDEMSIEKQMLHYLKEYKNTEKCYSESIERVVKVIDRYEKMVADYLSGKTCNPPLTWDELKSMTGKPVWIEEYWAVTEDETGVTEDEGDTDAYWAILTYADKKRISVVNGNVDQWLHKDIWNNHNVSHSWEAYRKERKN